MSPVRKHVEINDSDSSPEKDDKISMLTLQNQSSMEQTELLRVQNEGLKDLLSQKDLMMLRAEKDKKFMEI